MSEQNIKAITLFFFFTMLEEKRALWSASETLALIEKWNRRTSTRQEEVTNENLVRAMAKIWQKHRRKISKGRPQFSFESGWVLPSHIEFAPWMEFQKLASDEDLLTLVWSKILRFETQDIAKGLNLSEGTVRFRLGHALRLLGKVCPNAPLTLSGSER